MHFLYCSTHHAVARNVLVRAKHVLGTVVSVYMAGDKIDRNVFLHTVLDECLGPGSLRRGWPSHTQMRIHALDGCDSVIVKFPVRGLLRFSNPKVDIGFVPDFEVPP